MSRATKAPRPPLEVECPTCGVVEPIQEHGNAPWRCPTCYSTIGGESDAW